MNIFIRMKLTAGAMIPPFIEHSHIKYLNNTVTSYYVSAKVVFVYPSKLHTVYRKIEICHMIDNCFKS